MTADQIRLWAIEMTEKREYDSPALTVLQVQAIFEVAAQLAQLREEIHNYVIWKQTGDIT